MNVRKMCCWLMAAILAATVSLVLLSWTQFDYDWIQQRRLWMTASSSSRQSPLSLLLRRRQQQQHHPQPIASLTEALEVPEAPEGAEEETEESAQELFRYLHWTNSRACRLAVDFGFAIWTKGNMSTPDGYKAVCFDQLIAPVYNNCLVYSFGINNNEWTFNEAMAKFGCHVYSFDPSMLGVDDQHNRTELIHFYNLGLAAHDGLHPIKKWKMKTADSIYQMLADHHGNTTLIDVFKMDIEYAEWEVIPQMLQSRFLADKVKQLAVEIHFKADDSLPVFRQRIRIIQDLESSIISRNNPAADEAHSAAGGFVRFSSRPNPVQLTSKFTVLAGTNQSEYMALELSWYNSRFYQQQQEEEGEGDGQSGRDVAGPFFPYF
jgi:hypothetical protein